MSSRSWVPAVLLATLGVSGAAEAANVTFDTFVTGSALTTTLSNNDTIGFAYAGNKFVGSVYYGANNNQLYQTDLTGGNVQKFGAPLACTSCGEVYVSSSLGLGGFGPRDVFAGSEGIGIVYRFNNDGSGQVAFASSLNGGVRSIAFDPFGLYGGDMIVATSTGTIYRINSSGVKSVLATVGEDAEGLSFAPTDYGPYPKGTLVVASEGSGNLRAISPTGSVATVGNVASAEMLSFVPLNLGASGDPLEGFYAANFAENIIHAPATSFANYLGHLIVTGETTHLMTDLKWSTELNRFVSQGVIGQFPNQPEDGIFVTVDILKPGCSVTNTCETTTVPEPGSLLLLGLGLAGLAASRRRFRV